MTDEHRSRLTGTEAEVQTVDGRAIYGVRLRCRCDEALRCEDDDEDLAVATTTAATDSVGYWVCVLGILFFVFINSSVLCVLCVSVFGLLIC